MPIIVSKADLSSPIEIKRDPDRLYTPKAHPLAKKILEVDGTPSNIADVVPGSIGEGKPVPTPTPLSSQEPINDLGTKAPEADPRLLELARKEAEVHREREALKAEKAALEQQRSSNEPKPDSLTAAEWKAKFMSEGPESLGIGYQEMADKYLAQPSEQDKVVNELRAEMARMKDESRVQREAIEQAQKTAYDRAIKQIDSDTRRLVETNQQDYELISAEGAHQSVVDMIKSTYESEGILMSVQEAAQRVENTLLEKALKYAGLTKVKARTQTSAPTSEKTLVSFEAKSTSPRTTLTRDLEQAAKPMTAAEKRERAIARFQGKL